MKKTLPILVILFIINTYNSIAQERQNDATWDETINFINDNIRSIRGKIIWGNIIKSETLEVSLSDDNTILNVKNKSSAENYTQEDIRNLHLDDLSHVKLDFGENHSYLILSSRQKGLVNCKEEYGYSPCNFMEIGVADYEMKQRVLKALKHLAYLSNKKYDEKKKKSKF